MKRIAFVAPTLIGRAKAARLCAAGLAIGILTLFCGGSLRAGETGNNPNILPPDSTPGDLSYPEWHLAWWNWSMSLPANINPNLQVDDAGDLTAPAPHPLWVGDYDATVGNSGHVWFLAEAYATVVRDITIPSGTTLVFPLQNHMVWGWPPVQAAEDFYRAYLDLVLDTAQISCEIDGVPIQNLEQYRAQSPAAPMVLPENNAAGLPPGPYGMMVDDGYYLILAPLSVGTHTIHWTSTMTIIPTWDPRTEDPPEPPFPQGAQEVTYHITVVPSK